MRVTNTMIANQTIDRLQGLSTQMSLSSAQVSSGVRVNSVSDDPAAGSDLLIIDSNLSADNQYLRNIADAKQRASSEDSVLSSVSLQLERARELATQQDVTAITPANRAAAKAEVDAIIQSAVSLANTKNGQGYLFAENASGPTSPFTTTPPFTTTATTPSGSHVAEVGPGRLLATNHNGTQVFLNTKVLQSLKDLSNALGSNNQAAIETALGGVTAAHDSLQVLVAEHGGRAAAINQAENDMTLMVSDSQIRRSKIADIDLSEAMTRFASQQTAYQAALIATSKVLSLNLAEYIR